MSEKEESGRDWKGRGWEGGNWKGRGVRKGIEEFSPEPILQPYLRTAVSPDLRGQ